MATTNQLVEEMGVWLRSFSERVGTGWDELGPSSVCRVGLGLWI